MTTTQNRLAPKPTAPTRAQTVAELRDILRTINALKRQVITLGKALKQ